MTVKTIEIAALTVFLIVFSIAFTYVLKTQFSILPTSLWHKKIAEKFNDEPDVIKHMKITSTTGWIIPPDPKVIQPDDSYRLILSDEEKNKTKQEWNADYNQYFKSQLDKFHLQGKFLNYLYYSRIAPRKMIDQDIIGSGEKEKIFEGVKLGCADCLLTYIVIFTKNKTYLTNELSGALTPRADHKGFYLNFAHYGEKDAYCCPDSIVISKYEWNGNGFTEIARKTDQITLKN